MSFSVFDVSLKELIICKLSSILHQFKLSYFNTDNHFNISPAECREELNFFILFKTTWRLFEVPLTIGT